MNRWGVAPEEAGEARRVLGAQLTGVYTHLASADSDEEATRRQLDLFDRVLAATTSAAPSSTPRTPPARSGILAPTATSSAPASPCTGLHPVGDSGDPADEGLRPALSLKSYVASIRRLAPGEGVSYGLTFRAGEPTLAATVPVGYAEGYRRALSNNSEALIRGKRSPLLGRVTMDACVFAVDESVEVGDEVVLVGEQEGETIRAEEVARRSGTINYEVTTGLDARRVERSYGNMFEDLNWRALSSGRGSPSCSTWCWCTCSTSPSPAPTGDPPPSL
jgi:alanine racemase